MYVQEEKGENECDRGNGKVDVPTPTPIDLRKESSEKGLFKSHRLYRRTEVMSRRNIKEELTPIPPDIDHMISPKPKYRPLSLPTVSYTWSKELW